MELKKLLLNGIKNGRFSHKNIREIRAILKIKPKADGALYNALEELLKDGAVVRDRRGFLLTCEQAHCFKGRVQGNARGFAFVITDGGDFFVPRKSVNGAYDGDLVLAAPVEDTEDEAYIIKVLERGIKKLTGTIVRQAQNFRVLPDNPRRPEIFIPAALALNAQTGDKVVCEVTSFPFGRAPGGKVLEILGKEGDLAAEELSILREYGLCAEFPENAEIQAQKASESKICLDGRRDLRDKLIFTIDGADTRDIDDGVSLERDGKNYILGVHIADVSNYVKYKTALDDEAYARGTSVYFPDRVVPMLPKSLSNGACSLNENQERYALSCIMTFSPDGQRLDYEICESVIKSRHKTAYPEISALIAGDKSKYPDLYETVAAMHDLCLVLQDRRRAAGQVELDVREAHIYMENEEIVIPPVTADDDISHKIIELFMVSANEAVADFLSKQGAPCLFRVHEKPEPEKTQTFLDFLRDIGVSAKFDDIEDARPCEFARILEETKENPSYSVINRVMLRTMQKARYDEKNKGHFGLASNCYCHFTSPIRRYPDLFVHRNVKAILHGEQTTEFAENAHTCAVFCSERERAADDAERAVDDLYKLYYMAERIGEEYDATVSGVTSFGVFCELDNTVEGLIPLETLQGDYEFVPEKFMLCGKTGSYRLGQALKIKVTGYDLPSRKVYFAEIPQNDNGKIRAKSADYPFKRL